MRRYIVNRPLDQLPQTQYDVVIAGAGLSGLYSALSLARHLRCAILLKDKTFEGNSWLAQGGIAAVVNQHDHVSFHFADSLKASAGMASKTALAALVTGGPAEIVKLEELGVKFDRDEEGRLHTTIEGAHSRKRILHCGGDATGRIIMNALVDEASKRDNIHFLEEHFLTDILTDSKNEVCGAVAWNNGFKILKAPVVMICTGGVGALYKYTTNSLSSTGDGIAAARRAGAELMNMEFVQFHPTAFYQPGKQDSFLLISEAVRGEGGVLRNEKGLAFMENRHLLKDLAPRDVVAREMFFELQDENTEHLYLDITSRTAGFLRKRFPTVYSFCADQGIYMEKDMIPVVPAQHYLMGGIKTGLNGETSIKGLYACGEAACTGVHGANRLASNSLLECLVFAARTADMINLQVQATTGILPETESYHPDQILPGTEKQQIRELMQKSGGIVRNGPDIESALNRIRQFIRIFDAGVPASPDAFEVMNMALVAEEILQAALSRDEGIGSHYRSDSILLNQQH
jgi:L-aspartate oxidase